MRGIFFKTVSALCYDVARAQMPGCGAQNHYNDVTNFVLASWESMPRFLALPIRIATVGFAVSAAVTTGNFYHRLSPGRRAARLEAWRHARLRVCRDLIRFYSSLATLALYQREGVLPAARGGAEDRQAERLSFG